jgi:hypothetical protein
MRSKQQVLAFQRAYLISADITKVREYAYACEHYWWPGVVWRKVPDVPVSRFCCVNPIGAYTRKNIWWDHMIAIVKQLNEKFHDQWLLSTEGTNENK